MELRTLDRMADAAQTAALDALGQMLDEEEAEALNRDHEGIVYNAESTDVSRRSPVTATIFIRSFCNPCMT